MSAAPSRAPFLRAEWRHLLMLNYEVDPAVLAPLVPAGTVLDFHDGRALASVVAFRFLDTRLLGVPVPFHRDFDDVRGLYGAGFVAALAGAPSSAFVAEGSAVAVYPPRRVARQAGLR